MEEAVDRHVWRCAFNLLYVKELAADCICVSWQQRTKCVGVTAAGAGAEVKAAELCVGNAIPSRVSGGHHGISQLGCRCLSLNRFLEIIK